MFQWAWARIVEKLIESFYLASNLTARKALLAGAVALEKRAARQKVQAERLLAVLLDVPCRQFTLVKGRDILSTDSESERR